MPIKSFARIRCLIISLMRRFFGFPPSVNCWLEEHPAIANAIKWQTVFETTAYDVPETAKVAWPKWSVEQKNELVAAFEAAWKWIEMQSSSAIFSAASETLPYPPVNQANTSSGVGSPYTQVLPAYARDLFIRWIGLQLAVEIGGRVPWSVTSYNAEQLQVLFDSAAIMTRIPTGNFTIATGSAAHPNYVQRNDNLGESMIAPPWFTFAFLKNGSIVGGTRLVSIGALLQWCSANLAHFYGAFTYQETENHWQYRGNPPITSIINGTTNPTLTSSQFAHWTAGCHGTTGFIRNVLRAINIPVHISIVCGHSQSVFITENLYLDHGDDPYNQTFKATGLPASQLLIDQATYVSWFGSSTDNRSQGCNYIGHQVTVLAGP